MLEAVTLDFNESPQVMISKSSIITFLISFGDSAVYNETVIYSYHNNPSRNDCHLRLLLASVKNKFKNCIIF